MKAHTFIEQQSRHIVTRTIANVVRAHSETYDNRREAADALDRIVREVESQGFTVIRRDKAAYEIIH